MPQITRPVPAAGSGTDKTTDFITAPQSYSVKGVTYTPAAKMTGSDTNTRTLSLVNIGPVSNPKYTPIATLPLTSGVVLNAGQAGTIPLTTATSVATGDRIIWASTANGNGIPDPGGDVTVDV
jgi:hypothetical protein